MQSVVFFKYAEILYLHLPDFIFETFVVAIRSTLLYSKALEALF